MLTFCHLVNFDTHIHIPLKCWWWTYPSMTVSWQWDRGKLTLLSFRMAVSQLPSLQFGNFLEESYSNTNQAQFLFSFQTQTRKGFAATCWNRKLAWNILPSPKFAKTIAFDSFFFLKWNWEWGDELFFLHLGEFESLIQFQLLGKNEWLNKTSTRIYLTAVLLHYSYNISYKSF